MARQLYKLQKTTSGYYPSYWDETAQHYVRYLSVHNDYVRFSLDHRYYAKAWLNAAKQTKRVNVTQ